MVFKDSTSRVTLTQQCADFQYLQNSLPLLDIKDISNVLTPTSIRGPKGWDREPIVKTLVVMRWECYKSVSKVIKQLHRNRSLRLALGFVDKFSPEEGKLIPNIPSRRTFFRVFKKMQRQKIERMLENTFVRLTGMLKYIWPDLGVDVCVDATKVKSYSRRKPVSKGHAQGYVRLPIIMLGAIIRPTAKSSGIVRHRWVSNIARNPQMTNDSFRETK